jgi:hypothetical protein
VGRGTCHRQAGGAGGEEQEFRGAPLRRARLAALPSVCVPPASLFSPSSAPTFHRWNFGLHPKMAPGCHFRGPFPEPKGVQTFSRPQVKHFLGCKKSTKSNTCGSLFTCSGALLFPSTKTAKFQNPCISGHGDFECILYHVSTQEIYRQNLKRHRFSPPVLDNL